MAKSDTVYFNTFEIRDNIPEVKDELFHLSGKKWPEEILVISKKAKNMHFKLLNTLEK